MLLHFSSSNRLKNTPRTGFLPFPDSLPYTSTRVFQDGVQGNHFFSNPTSVYESKGNWIAGHLVSFPRIQDNVLHRENLHLDKRVRIAKQHHLAVITEGTMAPSLPRLHSSCIATGKAVLGVCGIVMWQLGSKNWTQKESFRSISNSQPPSKFTLSQHCIPGPPARSN